MNTSLRENFLQKLHRNPPLLLKKRRINRLIQVYQDLEKTLRSLKQNTNGMLESQTAINIRKLILQLSISKRRLERKIGNTLLIEKQHLKKRIKAVFDN